jgi:apolipoprotein N-acyltransferase
VTRGDAPTVLTGDIGLRSGGTLYTRIGDLFAWIAVVAAVALVGFRLVTRAQPAHDVLATSRSRG